MDDNSNKSPYIERIIFEHKWNNKKELNLQILYVGDEYSYDYNSQNYLYISIIDCLIKYYQIFYDIEFIIINNYYYYPKIMIPSYLKDSYVDNDNIKIHLR
jgi:hypothetical protein